MQTFELTKQFYESCTNDNEQYAACDFWQAAFYSSKTNLVNKLLNNNKNEKLIDEINRWLLRNDARWTFGVLGAGLHTATFRIAPQRNKVARVLQFTSGRLPGNGSIPATAIVNYPLDMIHRRYSFDDDCQSTFALTIAERGVIREQLPPKMLCGIENGKDFREINNRLYLHGFYVDDIHCGNVALFVDSYDKEREIVRCKAKIIDYGALHRIPKEGSYK